MTGVEREPARAAIEEDRVFRGAVFVYRSRDEEVDLPVAIDVRRRDARGVRRVEAVPVDARRSQRDRGCVKNRTGRSRRGLRRGLVDGAHFGQPPHARVLEFDDLAARIGAEILKHAQSPLGFRGSAEPLQGLRLAVNGAAQVRVEGLRSLKAGQRTGEIALLEAASRRVVLRKRVGGRARGHEGKLRQRLGGAPIVQQQQAEAVAGSEVLGIGGRDPFENRARPVDVALLLTIQRRDGEVDLQVASIGMRVRQTREDVAGGVEVELSHEADATVVESDNFVGRLTPRR